MFRASAQHIRITPLCGTGSDAGPNTPLATLLQVDGLTVLIDCGATVDFDMTVADAVRPYRHSIDAVLLSSPELRCCGSLPVITEMLRAEVPVFATIPTTKLGLMGTVSQLLDRFSTTEVDEVGEPCSPPPIAVASVHASFKRIQELQFEQTFRLTPISALRGEKPETADPTREEQQTETALSVRALPAGDIIGAAAFHMKHQTDSLLYVARTIPSTVETKTARGFNLATTGIGATVVVADAALTTSATTPDENPSSSSEEELLRVVQAALRKGGSVLFLYDVYAKAIEFVLRLHEMLEREGLNGYRIVFAAPKAEQYAKRLRTMSEFVAPGVFSEDTDDVLPVGYAQTAEEARGVDGVKCIMAHVASNWEAGLGADLLPEHLENPNSCIVDLCAGQPVAGTNRYRVRQGAVEAAGSGRGTKKPTLVDYTFRSRTILEGDQLAAYQELLIDSRRRAAGDAAGGAGDGAAEADGQMKLVQDEAAWSDSDDDEIPAPQSTSAPTTATAAAAGASSGRVFLPSHYPPVSSTFPMLPRVELAVATSAGSSLFGEPLPDADLKRFRQHTIEHSYAETALSDARMQRTALQDDSRPSRVEVVQRDVRVAATVLPFTLAPECTAQAYQTLLGAVSKSARHIVVIGGGVQQQSAAVALLRSAASHRGATANAGTGPSSSMQLRRNVVLLAPNALQTVDVATAVYTFEVRIDAGVYPTKLKEVTSSSDGGTWEVGWIDGAIGVDAAQVQQDSLAKGPRAKRSRAEAGDDMADLAHDDEGGQHSPVAAGEVRSRRALPALVPRPAGAKRAHGLSPHEAGSLFIGEYSADSLRHHLGRDHFHTDTAFDGGLVMAGDAVCMRHRKRDSQLGIEATLTPEQFAVRSSVYAQFGCVL